MGEITKSETLNGICDGIDIVFSSIGITRQKDGLTFEDVDYRGNANLLEEAKRSGSVSRFLFVSVYQASRMVHLELVKARERFVDDLSRSGLAYTVIRPTGFFSDLTALLHMANKGAIYLIGDGSRRLNPIHGEDLAELCVRAVAPEWRGREVEAGGPEVISHRELAELAFLAVGRPVKVRRVPEWLVLCALQFMKPFNKRFYGTIAFFVEAMRMDMVAPIPQGRSMHRL
ncbi:NAD(P)H-binding protein, partial [Mycobacterium tuberculosis]